MNVNRAIAGWHFVGVDLGQSRDFTVIAALERVPVGTPYPDIVERVKRTTKAPELDGWCHVAVDATGVGRPVVDLLRRAGLGARFCRRSSRAERRSGSSGGRWRR